MEWVTIFVLVVVVVTAVALWRRVSRREGGSLDGSEMVKLPYQRNSVLRWLEYFVILRLSIGLYVCYDLADGEVQRNLTSGSSGRF